MMVIGYAATHMAGRIDRTLSGARQWRASFVSTGVVLLLHKRAGCRRGCGLEMLCTFRESAEPQLVVSRERVSDDWSQGGLGTLCRNRYTSAMVCVHATKSVHGKGAAILARTEYVDCLRSDGQGHLYAAGLLSLTTKASTSS
jgi:hypothetical protein